MCMLVSRVSQVIYNNIVPTRVNTKRNDSSVNFGKITEAESIELARLIRIFPALADLGDNAMSNLKKVIIKTRDGIENAADGFSDEANNRRDGMLRALIKRGQQKEKWMSFSPADSRLQMHKLEAA